ncbi:MAG: DUF6485 family protein [Candidatus Freyarchaeota archaeon]
MKTECNVEENLKDCKCTYTSCGKRGKCCECLRSHWRRGELPGCLFPPELERTYDRPLKTFIEYYKDRI